MIIKSMSRTSGKASSLMNYMFHKPQLAKQQLLYQTRNEQLETATTKHLLKGKNMTEWIKEFEQNQEGRKFKRKDMVLFYHEIISFSPLDTELITDDILHDISRQYIRLRSPQAPAVSTIHRDVEHMHIHFCLAGCNYKTGHANRLTKSAFVEVKQEMEAYQKAKYPELLNSTVVHGKGLAKAQDMQFVNEERITNKREMVKAQVETVMTQANSYDDLLESLVNAGMPTYIRGEKVYGVTVAGRNYRFSTLGFSERVEAMKQEKTEMAELDSIRKKHNSRSRNTGDRFKNLDDLFREYNSKEAPEQELEEGEFIENTNTELWEDNSQEDFATGMAPEPDDFYMEEESFDDAMDAAPEEGMNNAGFSHQEEEEEQINN